MLQQKHQINEIPTIKLLRRDYPSLVKMTCDAVIAFDPTFKRTRVSKLLGEKLRYLRSKSKKVVTGGSMNCKENMRPSGELTPPASSGPPRIGISLNGRSTHRNMSQKQAGDGKKTQLANVSPLRNPK